MTAGTKYFTQLTNLAGGSIAGGDAYVIEDISAGETKYVTDTDLVAHLSGAIGSDGWIADTDTWVYVAANQYKVAGKDVTARFPKGAKIKLTNNTVKYFYVTAGVYGTDSTVTITGGADYTLASAAITSPYYSYADGPQGFPDWFSYTVTHGGFSSTPTYVAMFKVSGKQCFYNYFHIGYGTSNANTFTVSVPITAATRTNNAFSAAVPWLQDNSVVGACGQILIASAGTSANLYKTAQGTWTPSGAKQADFQIFYEI
jgi:hypothetical protein